MVHQPEMPVRVGSTKNVLKKLNVDEINFNKGLDENQRIQLAGRMRECIESDILHLEVYYMNDAKECAQEIISELQNIFQNTDNMTFTIKMCELGNLGAALESSKSAAVLKRMKEIEKKIETASETTACIILLPGKESYGQEDPKDAIRCGFALRNRLTQFIIPWKSGEEEDKEKQKAIEITIKSKIASAIEDLCRQLGYVRTLDEKFINKENMLVHTPVIGLHVMTQIKTLYGKARFLPWDYKLC